MRVLGLEGTAWCASAAVFVTTDLEDSDAGSVWLASEAYEPASGGINPREAAEHMRAAVPRVIDEALAQVDGPVDAVAFSRGPGLGPCLRIVGTAARALAQSLDVPLVGVNHMVAHLEVGRHHAGFDAPVCLNASGANAHVLAYRNGSYRVLGETMDTGVGNAIDKFTRHLDWSHPGGPKVEAAAREGSYVPLPYVVKGMDFSFSGITSAAQDAVDEGAAVEDVCVGLQETVFAMLAEVAERALALTGRDELVLGGGVGQNARLREMLAAMCAARGASFSAPEARFLRDNAGMIALLGARMFAAGETVSVSDSAVDPDFRPDEVDVTWHAPLEDDPAGAWANGGAAGAEAASKGAGSAEAAGPETTGTARDGASERRGAEATVTVGPAVTTKRRPRKAFRHAALDDRLRRDRTVQEARLTSEARRVGVPTPVVLDVDVPEHVIEFQTVGDCDLQAALSAERVQTVARHLATLHGAGVVHGDPTTRNVRVALDDDRVFLVDFGLGYYTDDVEDHAMDLHVLRQSLAGVADDPASLLAAAVDAYRAAGDESVLDRLAAVEGRGRYRD